MYKKRDIGEKPHLKKNTGSHLGSAESPGLLVDILGRPGFVELLQRLIF